MDLSQSKSLQFNCPRCGVVFDADVWLIVDTTARPDLLQSCLNDTIHTLSCPQGHPVRAGAPLLVIDRSQRRTIFSPGGEVTPGTADQGASLLRRAANAAGGAAGGLSDQVEVIPRSRLCLALNGRSRQEIGRLDAILQRLDQTDDLPVCRALYRQAFDILHPDDDPRLWAALHLRLASCLLSRFDGAVDQEAEDAIAVVNSACNLFTREDFPQEWAHAQQLLARAYVVRAQGVRAENLEQSIRAGEAAAAILTLQSAPRQFAALQLQLGSAYQHRAAGDPRENLLLAQQAFSAGLKVFPPETYPAEHTEILRRIGNLVESAPVAGSGAFSPLVTQLAEAAALFRRLAEGDPERFGPYPGDLFYLLGRACWAHNDLPAARQAFAEAVEAERRAGRADRAVSKVKLASNLSALGEIDDLVGNRRESCACLEESAAIYQALVDGGAEIHQAELAFVLSDLGKSRCPAGGRDAPAGNCDLAGAREAFSRAADLFRSVLQRDPGNLLHRLEYATAVQASAVAGMKISADQTDREELQRYRSEIEEAAGIFRQLADQGYPLHTGELTLSLNNLGAIWQRLGDTEAACRAYTEATLTLRQVAEQDSESGLQPLVDSFTALARLQMQRNQYAAARDALESALACLRRLGELRPGKGEGELAALLDLQGQVHETLGDEETARECFKSALELQLNPGSVNAPAREPAGKAASILNLVNVRRKMKDYDGALAGCLAANELLQGCDQRSEHYAELIAILLLHSGGIALEKGSYPMAIRWLQQAVASFRWLSQRSPEKLPQLAVALGNLGAAQMVSGDADSARTSLQESLVLKRLAADLHPELFSAAAGSALVHLGLLEADTGDPEAAADRYREAIDLFSTAGISATARAHELFACWNNLSSLFLERAAGGTPDYHRAREALRNAVRYAELSRGRFLDIGQRRRVLGEACRSYQSLIGCCVELWKQSGNGDFIREAVETAEASRARMLTEALSEEDLKPAHAPAQLAEEFLLARRRLRDSDRLLFEEERGGGIDAGNSPSGHPRIISNPLPPLFSLGTRGLGETGSLGDSARRVARIGSLRREVDRLRLAYGGLLKRVRDFDPDYDGDALCAPVGYDKIQALLPPGDTTAIVQFSVGEAGSYAFVVTRSSAHAVELPKATEQRLNNLAGRWESLRQGARAVADPSPARFFRKRSLWQKKAAEELQALSDLVMEPVLATLPPGRLERLILVPHRSLHVFPLHACPLPGGGSLLDDFELVYAPSLSLLYRCLVRKAPPATQKLVLGNPTGDLPFADLEALGVTSHYPDALGLHGRAITRDRFISESRGCQLLHYSGHGVFDQRDPLSSALVLEDRNDSSRWLTLRHVISGLRMESNSLCVLSGCETGLFNPDLLDEYVSLPLGFLSAGSRCVVSSFWTVDDLSTGVLFDRFYAGCRAGLPPAGALREAQLWLRDGITGGRMLQEEVVPALVSRVADEGLREVCLRLAAHYAAACPDTPPFASLLHWAPFGATGLGYELDTAPAP